MISTDQIIRQLPTKTVTVSGSFQARQTQKWKNKRAQSLSAIRLSLACGLTTIAQISERIGMSYDYTKCLLREMCQAGEVEFQGKPGCIHFYKLRSDDNE